MTYPWCCGSFAIEPGREPRGSHTLPLHPLSCTGGEKPSGREGKEGGFRAALLPVLSTRPVWLGDSETATVATKGVAAGLQ